MSLGNIYTDKNFDSNFLHDILSKGTRDMRYSRSLRNSVTLKIRKKNNSMKDASRKSVIDFQNLNLKNFLDIESLYQENFHLKNKVTELDTEHFILKQKLFEVEQEFNLKNEESHRFFTNNLSYRAIIPDLKHNLKGLKNILREKQAEIDDLKLKIKNKKIVEADNEVKAHQKECIKLKMFLEKIMMKQEFNPQLNNLEELYENNLIEINELNRIKSEYLRALELINKDFSSSKYEESMLEKAYKKKNNKARAYLGEILKYKQEYLILKQNVENQEVYLKNEENQIRKHNLIIENEYQENCNKLKNLEKNLLETTESIQKIIENTKHLKHKIYKTRTLNFEDVRSFGKLQNPPKFFIRLHEMLTKKNMMIAVFLSLLDKSNKGLLSMDEIVKSLEIEPYKIDRKDIENALRLIGCNEKFISLQKIEEWYEKYEYDQNPVFSAEQKPNSIGLGKNEINSEVNAESKNSETDENELNDVFEQIAIKLEISGLEKSRLGEALLDTTDPKLFFPIDEVEKRIISSRFKFSSVSRLQTLMKFIRKNIGPMVSVKDLKNKLSNHIRDLNILTSDQILQMKIIIHEKISVEIQKIRKFFKETFPKNKKGKIHWEDFEKSLKTLNISLPESCWKWWSLKFHPEFVVDYKKTLNKFKEIYPWQDSLNLIKEKITNYSFKLKDIFDSDDNGIVKYQKFLKGIKKLNLGLRSRDLYCVINALRKETQTDEVFTIDFLQSKFT